MFYLFSSPTPSLGDKNLNTIHSIITSPTKYAGVNLSTSPSRPRLTNPSGPFGGIISPVSNILSTNGDLSFDCDLNHKNAHRIHKRRSVSAATGSATTYISINDKNSRTARTNSSSAISIRSKSSTNMTNTTNPKRSHSPHSMTLLGLNKSPGQRKKQKISHYWALFGKSEQKLVSIDVSCFL